MPSAVLDDEGNENFNVDKVKNKWRSYFNNLCKMDCMNFDAEHYGTVMRKQNS